MPVSTSDKKSYQMIAYKMSSIVVKDKKEKNIKMIQTELCIL